MKSIKEILAEAPDPFAGLPMQKLGFVREKPTQWASQSGEDDMSNLDVKYDEKIKKYSVFIDYKLVKSFSKDELKKVLPKYLDVVEKSKKSDTFRKAINL